MNPDGDRPREPARETEGIVYRPATMDDSAALAELRWEFQLEDYPTSTSDLDRLPFVAACASWIRRRLELGTWTVWVAEERATGAIVS